MCYYHIYVYLDYIRRKKLTIFFFLKDLPSVVLKSLKDVGRHERNKMPFTCLFVLTEGKITEEKRKKEGGKKRNKMSRERKVVRKFQLDYDVNGDIEQGRIVVSSKFDGGCSLATKWLFSRIKLPTKKGEKFYRP